MNKIEQVPIALDCGCTIPPPIDPQQQGTLVVCPDHGIPFDIETAERVTTIRYEARRLTPAPELVDA